MVQTRPNVLIVDDDPDSVAFAGAILFRSRVAVDSAGSGDEALAKLRVRDYDAILLDLLLPRMNGFEVLREIKALRPEISRRVVVMSGASEATLSWIAPGDCFGILRKPVDAEVLRSTVLQLCGMAVEPARPASRRRVNSVGRDQLSPGRR
jgi:CheY-like chemotaxis protein